MTTAIIQGASGGLGLPLTRFLLQNTSLNIVALTSRASTSASATQESILASLPPAAKDRLHLIPGVDVCEEETLERAATEVGKRFGKDDVRLMVCLAGILHPEKSLSQINARTSLLQFQTNTLGHLLFYKHFVPLLPTFRSFPSLAASWGENDPANGWVREDGATLMSLSARVGSVGDNERGGWYSYRSSKSALSQVIRCLDHELLLRKTPALALAYHPGTTLTPFTRPIIGSPKPDPGKGLFTPEMAVERLMAVVKGARRGEGKDGMVGAGGGGGFWDWKGERVPW